VIQVIIQKVIVPKIWLMRLNNNNQRNKLKSLSNKCIHHQIKRTQLVILMLNNHLKNNIQLTLHSHLLHTQIFLLITLILVMSLLSLTNSHKLKEIWIKFLINKLLNSSNNNSSWFNNSNNSNRSLFKTLVQDILVKQPIIAD